MRNRKWLKKTAAMLLAGAMVCSAGVWTGAGFAAEVKAEETTGSPVISPEQNVTGSLKIHKTDNSTGKAPLGGATFSIYKVMSLTPGDEAGTYVKYEIVSDFVSVLDGITADALGNYSAEAIEALAEELAAAATAEGSNITAKDTQVTATDTGLATFSNLTLGYYLVVETSAPEGYMPGLPFLVAIPSTNNYVNSSQPGTEWVYDVEASPKNSSAGIDKVIDHTVVDSDTTSSDGTVKVGDYVPFKITTRIPDYTDPAYVNPVFTITDVMSEGLELVTEDTEHPIKVTMNGQDVISGNDTYTLTYDQVVAEETIDLTVTFAPAFLQNSANASQDVTITYYAKVTEDAVAGTEGNTNQASLEYTNKPGETTSVDTPEVKVYTFDINVVKFTNEGEDAPKALSGAIFELHKDSPEGEPVGPAKTTDKNGKLSFDKLDEGTYYLVETKSPAGYTLLANPIKVEIEAKENEDGVAEDGSFTLKIDGKPVTVENADNKYVSYKIEQSGVSSIAVENHKGFSLPATGGMGILLFLAVGVAGIVVVSVLLTRKSKDAK